MRHPGPASLLGLILPALFLPGSGARDSGAGEIVATAAGAAKRFEALVSPGDRAFCVGHRFVESGTDSVVLAGRPLTRGRDYTFDYDQGCLFLDPDAGGDSLLYPAGLVVTFRPLPLRLRSTYAHRDLSGGATDVKPAPSRPEGIPGTPWTPGGDATVAAADTASRSFPVRPATGRPGAEAGRPELELSGSKTFTFELGSNRDLTLRQTLDLRVNGTIARDVQLRAILSDRNLPFQPEGNTAELEELDKVLIEVEGPGARVGLGDQDLTVAGGTLAAFSRRLQGLTADVGKDGPSTRVVAASQRGEFRSFEFLGTDGKQGPYPLTDRSGGRGIVVVAGSERVWVDGIEMVRGLENDYTVDYGRAELSFTPRRVITADSRVAVDYEFSATGYRRSLYFAGGSNRPAGDQLRVAFKLARESDDRGRPLSGELTDAEKNRLAAAGDSLIGGGSGIRLIGEGLGRYTLAFDATNSRSFYRFVGRGQGNYEIAFVEVGQGLADYADSLAGVDTVYVYRGPNGGAFAPAGGIAQPVTHALGHVSASLPLGDRGVVSGELALSGRDLNTFSPIDDDDNNGSAGRVDLVVEPLGLAAGGRELGTIELAGRLRNLGSNFATLGRLDQSFSYDRDWNLPSRTASLAERRGEVVATYRPRRTLRLSSEFGDLSGGGRTAGRRLFGFDRTGTTFGSASLLRVTSGVDTTGFGGRLERETARSGTKVLWLAPVVYYEHEDRSDPASGVGRRYTIGGGDVTFGAFGPLSFSVGAESRDNDARPGVDQPWNKVSRALTRRGSVRLAGAGGWNASGVYQARDVSTPTAGKNRTDLATVDVSRRSGNNAFVTDLHYQVATAGVETRRRTLRFVGDGQGNYDAFGNLFPGGGYELEEGGLGAEQLTTDLDLSLRVEMNPYRATSPASGRLLEWARQNLAWDGTFRIEEQSRLPLGRPSNLFDPSSYQQPGQTIRGRIQVRQDLEIYPQSRRFTLRLRQNLDDVANYQFTNFREDRTEHLGGLNLRTTPGRWTAELEQRFGVRSQQITLEEALPRKRSADVLETRGSILFRPQSSTRLSIEATWRLEKAEAGMEARSLELNPRVSYLVGRRGRLDLTGRWITANREGGYTGIGGFSTLFLQDRVEVTLNGDYRLREAVTLGFGLNGRRFEGSDTVIDGRTEVRAYF